MEDHKIMESAERDVALKSYVLIVSNEIVKLSNGLQEIFVLALVWYKKFNLERNQLLKEKQELIDRILSFEPTYLDNNKSIDEKIRDKEVEVSDTERDIALLKAKITDKNKLNADFGKRVKVTEEEPEDNNEKKTKIKSKKFWKTLSVLAFILVFEFFMGLSQIEFLSDFKSDTAIGLRVASSVILLLIIHISEFLYKKRGRLIFKWMIPMLALIFILNFFLPLTLNHFYPEQLGDSINDFSLNETNVDTKDQNLPIVTFFKKFDFLPSIIGVIIFMIVFVMTKDKKLIVNETKEVKENFKVISPLEFLKKQLSEKKEKLGKLQTALKTLSLYSDKLNSNIKEEIRSLDETLTDVINKIESTTLNIKVKEEETMVAINKYGSYYNRIIQQEFGNSGVVSTINIKKHHLKEYLTNKL